MTYEAHLQERTLPVLAVTRTLLILATGVALGLVLAQVGDSPEDSQVRAAFEAGTIVGEDWHGNVRRSAQ